jgi:alpha-ketoglutarate-dependent taurine dioxygenase
MATQIADPRAWSGQTVDERGRWYLPLAAEFVRYLTAFVRRNLGERQTATELRLTREQREEWSEYVAPAVRDLEAGRGFVILEPADEGAWKSLSEREAAASYWVIGQLLGEPFAQNVQGTLLYDVRDTGQELSSGARFSVTNYESSFHTDNSFGDEILDYVGLLCLKTAKSGGISQNVSGIAVHRVLAQEHPEVLRMLYQPMHVDRRGGFREGESPTVLRPVFGEACTAGQTSSGTPAELIVRYLRYWIEVGQEKAGQPLSAEQRRALDVLDGVLARPDLRVEFALEPGQMYFINNRWILHNRTAFVDHPEPERRRHLVRLWLRRRGGASR